ncbi:MAG: tail fiber protein [Hellea sp.]
MSQGFIGQIIIFAGNFAPRSWALCEGQLIAVNSNSALFSILGTIYGGDGRTSFALPDLRGRVALHAGNGPGLSDRRLGARGGQERITLTSQNMPAHAHGHTTQIHVVDDNANSPEAAGRALATATGSAELYTNVATEGDTLRSDAATVSALPAGAQQAMGNDQPFLAMNFIICLFGTYPSRN